MTWFSSSCFSSSFSHTSVHPRLALLQKKDQRSTLSPPDSHCFFWSALGQKDPYKKEVLARLESGLCTGKFEYAKNAGPEQLIKFIDRVVATYNQYSDSVMNTKKLDDITRFERKNCLIPEDMDQYFKLEIDRYLLDEFQKIVKIKEGGEATEADFKRLILDIALLCLERNEPGWRGRLFGPQEPHSATKLKELVRQSAIISSAPDLDSNTLDQDAHPSHQYSTASESAFTVLVLSSAILQRAAQGQLPSPANRRVTASPPIPQLTVPERQRALLQRSNSVLRLNLRNRPELRLEDLLSFYISATDVEPFQINSDIYSLDFSASNFRKMQEITFPGIISATLAGWIRWTSTHLPNTESISLRGQPDLKLEDLQCLSNLIRLKEIDIRDTPLSPLSYKDMSDLRAMLPYIIIRADIIQESEDTAFAKKNNELKQQAKQPEESQDPEEYVQKQNHFSERQNTENFFSSFQPNRRTTLSQLLKLTKAKSYVRSLLKRTFKNLPQY